MKLVRENYHQCEERGSLVTKRISSKDLEDVLRCMDLKIWK